MILHDDTLPDNLQTADLIQEVNHANYLGTEDGVHAFGYAMTTLSPCKGGKESLIMQMVAINDVAVAFQKHIDYTMLYFDVRSEEFSTWQNGLTRLNVACHSSLFDCKSIIAQAYCRITRFPDELEVLEREWKNLGKTLEVATIMPVTAMGDVDAYFQKRDTGYPFSSMR